MVKGGSLVLYFSWSHLKTLGNPIDYLNELRKLKFLLGTDVYGLDAGGEPKVKLVPTIFPVPFTNLTDQVLFSDLAEALQMSELCDGIDLCVYSGLRGLYSKETHSYLNIRGGG